MQGVPFLTSLPSGLGWTQADRLVCRWRRARGSLAILINSTLSGKTETMKKILICLLDSLSVQKEKDGSTSEVKDSYVLLAWISGVPRQAGSTPCSTSTRFRTMYKSHNYNQLKNIYAYVTNKEEMTVVIVLGCWDQVNFFLLKNLFHVAISLHWQFKTGMKF